MKKTSNNIYIYIYITLLTACLLLTSTVLTGCNLGANSKAYSNASDLFEAGEYESAAAAFEELGDYKDSAEQAKEARYQQALKLADHKEYEEATDIFEQLGDFKDSAEQADTALKQEYSMEKICQYIRENGNYEDEIIFDVWRSSGGIFSGYELPIYQEDDKLRIMLCVNEDSTNEFWCKFLFNDGLYRDSKNCSIRFTYSPENRSKIMGYSCVPRYLIGISDYIMCSFNGDIDIPTYQKGQKITAENCKYVDKSTTSWTPLQSKTISGTFNGTVNLDDEATEEIAYVIEMIEQYLKEHTDITMQDLGFESY